MIDEANLLVSSLSALANCAQSYAVWGKRKSKLKAAQIRLDTPLKKGGSQIAKVIDDDLLSKLSDKVRTQAEKHVLAMSSVANREDAGKIADVARQEICFYLTEVRKHNQGDLPTKRLQDYWKSYRCEHDYCEGSWAREVQANE